MKMPRHTTTFILIVLLLFILTGVGSQGNPAFVGRARVSTAAQGRCGSSWSPVKRAEFSVQMPTRVKPERYELPGMPGEMYRATWGGVTYAVRIVRDAGSGLGDQKRLDNFRALYWQSLSGSSGGQTTMKSITHVPLNGFTGQQFEVKSDGVRSLLNLYVRDDSIYAIEATPLGDASAECFLNSFNLSALPPPTTTGGGNDKGGTTGGGTGGGDPPTPNVYTCDCGQGLVEEVEGNESEHKLVICPAPEMSYPKSLRQAGVEGSGMLRVKFPATGAPQVIEVLVSVHPVLDQSAITAIQQTTFCPETHDGVPIDVLVRQPFKFDLIRSTVNTPAPTGRRRKRP